MSGTTWVKFSWVLENLPAILESPAMKIEFEMASGTEFPEINDVVIKAYESDSAWSSMIDDIKPRMRKRIEETLGKDGAWYIIARDKNKQIVGVSGVAKEHWTKQNLLTGICVLPGYRRSGIGKNLLYYSLAALKAFGLAAATVYTEKGSLADLKLYTAFGSDRIEDVIYPGNA